MLWQINLFEVEFKNGARSQFIADFAYEHAVIPYTKHNKLGIHMVWSHVLTWGSPAEGLREDRLAYAREHIFTGRKEPKHESH